MGENYIVTGLGFGDEGKGTIVDYLARQVERPLIVRHNGGSQAAHNVITPEGKHHTFAQFGAGTFAGARTFLSQFTVLNPANMITEAQHLLELGIDAPLSRLRIADSALIITPYHIAANRMRENHRGDGRHGSCGQGIGETVEGAMKFPELALRAKDLLSWYKINDKLRFWREVKRVEMQELGIDTTGTVFDDDDLLKRTLDVLDSFNHWGHSRRASGSLEFVGSPSIVADNWLEAQFDKYDIIFEGAQGVLLDESLGFHPHTTWSNTTPHNARLLLGGRDAKNIGVTRTYTTRHGAGPFPSDLGSLGQQMFPEEHNGVGEYQGAFRVGAFDFIATTYAADALKLLGHQLDGLAVTHVDRMPDELPAVWEYEIETRVGRDAIRSLPPFKDQPNRAHQDRLTHIAAKAEPVFKTISEKQFWDWLPNELETPVWFESHGPTHQDKKDLR